MEEEEEGEEEKIKKVEKKMEGEVEETLTEDQQADAVDEDPGLLRWSSVHHHEALIAPCVSHLDVVNDK